MKRHALGIVGLLLASALSFVLVGVFARLSTEDHSSLGSNIEGPVLQQSEDRRAVTYQLDGDCGFGRGTLGGGASRWDAASMSCISSSCGTQFVYVRTPFDSRSAAQREIVFVLTGNTIGDVCSTDASLLDPSERYEIALTTPQLERLKLAYAFSPGTFAIMWRVRDEVRLLVGPGRELVTDLYNANPYAAW